LQAVAVPDPLQMHQTERLSMADTRDPWGEDEEYPVQDWRMEVANDDTRLGYWDWVDNQRIANAEDDELELVPEMTRFRCRWSLCPHCDNREQVTRIEAAGPEDAKQILKRHIEQTTGRTWYSIFEVKEDTDVPAGKVL
jgi:hypothetical protein